MGETAIFESPDQLVHAANLLTRVEHEAERAQDHLNLHLLEELLLALENASNEGTLLVADGAVVSVAAGEHGADASDRLVDESFLNGRTVQELHR